MSNHYDASDVHSDAALYACAEPVSGVKVLARYEACSECVFFAEYGNHSEYDEAFDNDRWLVRQEFLSERFGRLFASHPVVVGDSLGVTFDPCEVCGQNDGGDHSELIEFDR